MNGKRAGTKQVQDLDMAAGTKRAPHSSGGFLLDPHEVVKVLSSSSMLAALPASADFEVDIPISIAPPRPDPAHTSSVPPSPGA